MTQSENKLATLRLSTVHLLPKPDGLSYAHRTLWFADAAGIRVSLQICANGKRRGRRRFFAEHSLPGKNSGYMIRRGDFKYSYYVSDMPELYDLRTDPEEMKNLALLPEYQSKVKEMQAALFAWYRPPQAAGR